RASAADTKTLPHSTSMAARPRYGSTSSAVAFTASSNSATSTMRRGAAASSRRATACPTSPLPPKIIAVRSRSSMESLDGLDLLRRGPPVLALGESPQTHRSIRHAVKPLDLQPQRVGQPPHDALPATREGELYLDARSGGPPPRGRAPAHHVAHGIVERKPREGCRAHRPPVHRHALPRRVDARAARSHGAVHAHAAVADQVLGLAARRHACARQRALQAHQRHSGSAAAAGGAGGRSATDSSSSRGSSSRSLSPRISRNCGVVPYQSGRPRPSPRVTTSTSPRSASLSITASESTPP